MRNVSNKPIMYSQLKLFKRFRARLSPRNHLRRKTLPETFVEACAHTSAREGTHRRPCCELVTSTMDLPMCVSDCICDSLSFSCGYLQSIKPRANAHTRILQRLKLTSSADSCVPRIGPGSQSAQISKSWARATTFFSVQIGQRSASPWTKSTQKNLRVRLECLASRCKQSYRGIRW